MTAGRALLAGRSHVPEPALHADCYESFMRMGVFSPHLACHIAHWTNQRTCEYFASAPSSMAAHRHIEVLATG